MSGVLDILHGESLYVGVGEVEVSGVLDACEWWTTVDHLGIA